MQQQQRQQCPPSSRGKPWQSDNQKFSIVFRKDRSPILVLQKHSGENPNQICQLVVRHFGDPDTKAVVDEALATFTILGIKVSSGAIDEKDVRLARDELVREVRGSLRTAVHNYECMAV